MELVQYKTHNSPLFVSIDNPQMLTTDYGLSVRVLPED